MHQRLALQKIGSNSEIKLNLAHQNPHLILDEELWTHIFLLQNTA